jgi:PAS domain-containing protein
VSDTTFQDLHWLLDIIQSADIGIMVLSDDGTIDVFNRFMQVHSDVDGEDAVGSHVYQLFPYLNSDWFKRRVRSVFELGVPAYITHRQRSCVFRFPLTLPVHHEVKEMYQNVTFIPLRSSNDEVQKVCVVVYDVTEAAINAIKLEQAQTKMLAHTSCDK